MKNSTKVPVKWTIFAILVLLYTLYSVFLEPQVLEYNLILPIYKIYVLINLIKNICFLILLIILSDFLAHIITRKRE